MESAFDIQENPPDSVFEEFALAANGIDFQNIPIETPQALAALRSDDWMNEIYPLWIGAHGVMITLRRMARPSTRRRYAPWTKLKRKN
jgi:hypothetical protein